MSYTVTFTATFSPAAGEGPSAMMNKALSGNGLPFAGVPALNGMTSGFRRFDKTTTGILPRSRCITDPALTGAATNSTFTRRDGQEFTTPGEREFSTGSGDSRARVASAWPWSSTASSIVNAPAWCTSGRAPEGRPEAGMSGQWSQG